MEAGFIPVGGALSAPQHLNVTSASQVAPPGSKVIRPPGLKRGKTEESICDRIKLESVFGLTVSSNAALDSAPNSEVVAYPAGCTVVLYNTRKNRQNHILNASRKTITCLTFSGCGRYLATGECGHAPCVRIWDLQDPGSNGAGGNQLAEFPSHKYGVNCVAFSVNSKYLVSVGSQHDMIVNVWEWKAGLKLASNKVSSKVKAVSFAESGAYFVTVGNRHVKFWYLEYSRGAKYKEPVPLMGRSAILGEQRNNDFCDVACGRGECADSTYAITRSGLLCEFNNRRLLDKWVELRTPSANCMSLGTNYIFVGCADGIVRCFSPSTLQFVTTLPRTHYLGVDVSQGLNISHMFTHPPNAKYPDAIALTYDEKYQRLTCVYNDHSLYVWDVRDIKRVGKSHSSLYHSACIWGVEVPPEPLDGETSSPLPPGTFMTCSSDDTVRMWVLPNSHNKQYANIYSDELQRVLYMDPDHTYLKDVDLSSTGEKDKPVSYDGKNGVRCIRVSGDGMHLASGDRAGNVRIHDLISMQEICRLEAHNAEVLCLEYCNGAGKKLLASASRDRLIHVFHVDDDYHFMQTLDDHSSSITAVRFLANENSLQMVSCGADKTILFRSLVEGSNGGPGQFVRGHNCSARSTLYDMEVDCGGRHVLAACQDRAVRVYNTRSGRHTKTFRASLGDEGSLIKVVLDRSGIYVATSCTNKSLSVYDYYSGECMATMFGHSELVTGLRFTADCQHLISASGDGCIFVWKVPHDMVVTMRARLAQQAIRQGRRPASSNGVPIDSESDRAVSPMMVNVQPNIAEDPLVLATRDTPSKGNIPPLDLGRLPPWAQKTIGGDASNTNTSSPPQAVVRGKWAQRAEKNDYYIEPERPLESDGSKDSSLDSGTDTRIYNDSKQDLMDSKQVRMRNGQRSERPKSLNLSMLEMKRTFDPLEILPSPYTTFTSNPRAGILKNVSYKEEKVSYPWLSTLSESRKFTAERDYNENVSNVTKLSRGLDRIRHHTDDSSLGSFKYEDLESTEHDGDIEDISDGERTSSSDHTTQASDRIIYYPDNNDDQTPSEYTVNAMDVEELRQSQRKSKKPILPLPLITLSATSVSGSGQDSDEDEDEVSTPSGDNGDRNPLSGSCESLERIAQRASFLKSAFESLSGAEMDTSNSRVNSSISSQHHKTSPPTAPRSSNTSSQYSSSSKFSNNNSNSTSRVPAVPPRNAALISAAKQSMNDPSRINKRQELTRRIEETKKQLESVGYRTKLKSSQSTMDLSYRHGERDLDSRPPASRQRPLSQNLSSSNSRTYNSDNVQANSLQSSTNIPSNISSQYRDENINPAAQNYGNEMFYDSLTTNDNNNKALCRPNPFSDTNKKNPYDIPANLYRRNCYNVKLDDLNCTHSEFMKRRQEMFDNKSSDAERFHTTYQTDFSSKNRDSYQYTRGKSSLAYTIDIGKNNDKTKIDNNIKPGKVFDRLFPNANKSTDISVNPTVASKQTPPSRNFVLNLNSTQNTLKVAETNKSQNSRSILKNYKSCPVSPVSEECKWGDLLADSSKQAQGPSTNVSITQRITIDKTQDVRKRKSMSYFMDFDTKSHLMKDNGKSLVDSIKSDTEKMIAEITKKYGDLDDYEPKPPTSETLNISPMNKIEINKIDTAQDNDDDKNDGNFSSDSLEDCSLSQDISNKNKVFTKRICKKHNKPPSIPTGTRRCVSDYEIYTGNDVNNIDYYNQNINYVHPYAPATTDIQKSSTLPKNMSSNLDEYGDGFCAMSMSQEHLNNYKNNNIQRCYSALTKRCVTMSNESFLSDENSNCSSISNEIFMKYGGQNAFAQQKVLDNKFIDNSQNCSYENLCYEADPSYLERHRHSSASFFLNQRKMMKGGGSQESVLSDDLLQSDSDNQMISKTNCNSLESILSDDSEYTRSAPLEILFERKKQYRNTDVYSNSPSGVSFPKSSQSCYEFENQSKSYGSSPNNNSFVNYMQPQVFRQSEGMGFGTRNIGHSVYSNNVNVTYGFDVTNDSMHKSVTRSISLQDSGAMKYPQKKNIAYYFDGKEIKEYDQPVINKRSDEIPTMKSKNEEYRSHQSKSLFTNCEEKYKYICSVEGMETNYVNKSKSCSFEVVMEPASSVKPAPMRITEKSHVQKNLEKFENQIRKHVQNKSEKNQSNNRHGSNNCTHKNNGKFIATKSLERNTGVGNKNSNCKQVFDFVPHKPPKPVKRTSSVKLTNRNRIKPNYDKYGNMDTGAGIRAKIDGLQLKNSNTLKSKGIYNEKENKHMNTQDNEEKSYNIFISEKESTESKSEFQMDSLEYLENKKQSDRASDFSLDSLDNILDDKIQDNLSKDSLTYDCFTESTKFASSNTNLTSNTVVKNSVSNKNMPFLKMSSKEGESSTNNNVNTVIDPNKKANILAHMVQPEDVDMYKDIERKIDILNKLVELEEKKIMEAKFLKECRMRPLKANFSDGKGTVKLLSKNFEKLASKHQTKGILDASDFFSLTYDDFEGDKEESSSKLEMKRNLSLPDVLDVEKLSIFLEVDDTYSEGNENRAVSGNQASTSDCSVIDKGLKQNEELLNNATECKHDGKTDKDLKQRVYNFTVIPKTDIHIDSENYESSTTSSSCTNSPKRLTSSSCSAKSKTSKLSSLFRSKFDRGKISGAVSSDTNPPAIPKTHVKPVISPIPTAKPFTTSEASGGLLRKHSLQQPLLPSKLGFTQGGRNRLSPNDFNSLIDDNNSGLRRAISLSDLAFKPSPSPRTSLGSMKSSQGGSTAKPTSTRGPSPRHVKNYSNMIRSNSVGVLNQSDSESEAGTGSRGGRLPNSRSGGLMRPTISSQNKVAPTAARRRGVQPAYSSVNLSTVGQEDSSSEETNGNGTESRVGGLGNGNKPAVPPRPPKSLIDSQGRIVGRSGSERDLSSKAREVTQRLTSGPNRKHSIPSLTSNNTALDPNTGQVTPMAAQQLAQKFTKLTAKVVSVYSTLSDNPKDTSEVGKFGENLDMLQDLESAMLEAQKMLSQVIGRMKAGNPSDHHIMNFCMGGENETSHEGPLDNNMSRAFDELVSKGQPAVNGEVNQAMCMMDKYSDILYNVVKDISTTNGQTHSNHQDGS